MSGLDEGQSMKFGPIIIMEKGVSLGVVDSKGDGIGFLYDPYQYNRARLEPSFKRGTRRIR
jgi:hypothetical protein